MVIFLGRGLRFVRLLCLLAMAASFVVGGALQVQASKSDLVTLASEKQSQDPSLVLTRGMAEIVDVPGPVADIMVANPDLIDVTVLQSNRLYVVGVNYGTTNVIAVDAEGNVVSRLNVHVKVDDIAIQNMIDKLFPDEDVKITSTRDQIILTGTVSNPDVAQRVTGLVAQYAGGIRGGGSGSADELIVNLMNVSGEQQVMLRVRVVEASRDVLRELGIETEYTEAAGMGQLTGGIAAASRAGLTATPLGVASVIYDAAGDGLGPLSMVINALETEGLVNTLAEPNLTAISGEQAGFLAGGEFPIPVSRDRDGNILVDYRPFGVALNFRPTVLSSERISLQLQTEVSSISNQNTVSGSGITLPSFSVRRASTTVEMGSGGSLMIAGLLQSEITKGLNQLPGIKNIPILGDLISSDSFQRSESELVVIVTAFLVRPYADSKTYAQEAPEQAGNPLAQSFAANIRKTYAKLSLSDDLFAYNERFGYLLK